jgi:predicted metal-dependent hydrolase
MDRSSERELVESLVRDARVLAGAFGLVWRAIEAERPNVRRRYGVCYSDGTIRIRLRHAVTGSPLKYSSLVNTLCHELAHLRHFDHGPRFKALYLRILEFARARGIYRPRTSGAVRAAPLARHVEPVPRTRRAIPRRAAAAQLELFEGRSERP